MWVNCTDIYVKLYYSRTGKDTNNMFLMVLRSFFFQYNHKHILTACQDRNVRVYMVGNGKHIKTFKGSVGEDGTLIKVVLDRSGVYLGKFEFFSWKHNGNIHFLKMRDKPEMEVFPPNHLIINKLHNNDFCGHQNSLRFHEKSHCSALWAACRVAS